MFNGSFCPIKQKDLSQIACQYSIDLDGKQETSKTLSTFFKSANPIILETKEECLIGEIIELQVFDGHIYVLDIRAAKSLLVFDMTGRFIRKIGSLGQGPGEYTSISNFTLDTENRFIYLLDHFQRVHKYQLDGTFVSTITPKVQNANIIYIQYHSKRLYMNAIPYNPTLNDYMLLEADPDNGEVLSKSLSFKYNKGWTALILMDHSCFIPRLNGPPLYTQLFMDNIVSIGEDVKPYIELKSKNLVTEKDIKNIRVSENANAMVGEFRAFFQKYPKIFDVHSYVENDEFILFMYQRGLMNREAVIFHKKTELVELGYEFGQNLIYKDGENHFWGGFAFSDSNGAYEILHVELMENFVEEIRNDKIVSDFDKLEQLKQLDDESNPVILFYEFK